MLVIFHGGRIELVAVFWTSFRPYFRSI